MELSAERLAQLAAYCRIDAPTDAELELLVGLYESAAAYMTTAGVAAPAKGTPRRAQYDLCVNYMVLDAYDLRDETITGAIVNENPAFRRLINQLKWSEPAQSATDGTEGS